MNAKHNKIFFGIVLLLLAIFIIIQRNGNANYGSFSLILTGFAFSILYITKQKSWSFIVGTYFFYFGIVSILTSLFKLQNYRSFFTFQSFFIVPGFIFLVLYFQKNKRALLFPGSFLFWMGVYLFLDNFKFINMHNSDFFLIFLGLVFVTAYILDRMRSRIWALYLGLALIIIGLLKITLFRFFNIKFSIFSKLLPFMLIVFAIIFIYNNKKPNN